MIKILTFGTKREKYLQSAIGEFSKRLEPRRLTFESMDEVREDKIIAKLQKEKDKYNILILDQKGQTCSSEGFAQLLKKPTLFVIGDAFGLPESVKKAHATLSLSSLTLTHEFALAILLEQIYRGYTILENKKYHK